MTSHNPGDEPDSRDEELSEGMPSAGLRARLMPPDCLTATVEPACTRILGHACVSSEMEWMMLQHRNY
jgi:hypothetical protein